MHWSQKRWPVKSLQNRFDYLFSIENSLWKSYEILWIEKNEKVIKHYLKTPWYFWYVAMTFITVRADIGGVVWPTHVICNLEMKFYRISASSKSLTLTTLKFQCSSDQDWRKNSLVVLVFCRNCISKLLWYFFLFFATTTTTMTTFSAINKLKSVKRVYEHVPIHLKIYSNTAPQIKTKIHSWDIEPFCDEEAVSINKESAVK